MSIKNILSLLLIACCAVCSMAQSDASKYIDSVMAHAKKASGITAQFTMKGDERSGHYLQGTLMMKGEKFRLSTNDITTWYDGKTMWTYAASIGEVNITTPTRHELMEINPYLILDNYSNSFIVNELPSRIKGERVFRLTPTKRNTPFTSITVTIATAQQAPISFEININNNITQVAVTQYNDKAQLPASTFTFDAASYPNVTVIDLR